MKKQEKAPGPVGGVERSGTEPTGPGGERGRFTSRRKLEAVLRLLRGEDLDALSRELGITAHKIAEWKEDFLAAGQAGLKSRHPDAQDEEIRQLKEALGDTTMRLKIHQSFLRLRGIDGPFGKGSSK